MKLCSHSIATALVGFFFCACAFVTSARSQTCNFSVTNVAFGTVDVTANAAVDTVATVSVTCSALVSVALRVCVNLGIGSGGATNAANRFMKSGANALTYGLFSDAARTIPWGSNFWAGGAASPVLVDFPLFIGTSTQTRTLYGRVYSGQQTVPAGSYLSSFSSTDAEIQYGLLSLVTCNLLTNTSTTSFNVTATVPTTCTVAANNLNFGTAGVLTANTDATTTLSPTCTSGTPYNIGLDKGVNGGSVTTRQMKAGGPALINYSLFRDAGRTMNWGQTIGTDTATGTGTGLAQSVTAYGRIPPQTTPSPGTYNDTIVVTLTY